MKLALPLEKLRRCLKKLAKEFSVKGQSERGPRHTVQTPATFEMTTHQMFHCPRHDIVLYHNWLQALEKPGRPLRILLLRVPKDFLQGHTLLTKVANTGLPDCVTRWITSFLGQRH